VHNDAGPGRPQLLEDRIGVAAAQVDARGDDQEAQRVRERGHEQRARPSGRVRAKWKAADIDPGPTVSGMEVDMSTKWISMLALLFLNAVPVACLSADPATVPEIKRTALGLYLTAEEAYEMVQADPASTLFVDVRSIGEVQFLGMPTMADANVPYMLQSEWNEWDEARSNFKFVVNAGFADELARRLAAKGLQRTDPVILMCRSGDRSAKAADLLAQLGYAKVYSMIDGFEGDLAKDGPDTGRRTVNGWKNAKLPWSYRLDHAKMYNPEK
jgi:rhodanese-related sulfurtransferase